MASNIEYTTTGKPHPYHLVRPSIWPLLSSFAGGFFALMMVMYFPAYREALHAEDVAAPFPLGPVLGLVTILICMFFWWKDVIYEAVIEKVHNKITEVGFRFGMMLFIASEVMFFFAFFWAFFSSAFFPSEAIGYVWPPANIHIIEAFGLPFLMTMILLLSGCAVTWAHHAVMEGDQKGLERGLFWSVILGVIFLCFQVFEYGHATFGFTEGIYSSTFYMATGFHGFHVLVGTIFLFVCYIRAKKGHFTKEKHFAFEAAAWYWHFVDVVWLFLFVAIYWWGNSFGMDHTALMGVEAAPAMAAPAAH